ncbi:MAG: hypothetical protein HY817_02975 [Candidatus Abawacabacteria bacterium]|nr:hypothetical protein [Candidatus Abawacabacteria bacterium]
MEKYFRLVSAWLFLLFITGSYFWYHPSYLNLQQIFKGQGQTLAKAFSCPGIGVVYCSPGIVWKVIILIALIVFAISFSAWVYKESAKVQWTTRPITLFGYFNILLLFVLGFYFFDSIFYTQNQISFFSAIWSFFSYWLTIALVLLVVLTLSAGVGYRVLQLLKIDFAERAVRVSIAAALGLTIFIWLGAILGQFQLYTFVPIIFIALVALLFSYSVWRKVLNDIYWAPIHMVFSYNTISWFLLAALALVLAMNVIDLIRPFPIGWDDLGVYMNFPRQIASHGALLQGYPGQAYMLISALGFILFNSTTLALFFSWFGGVLAIYALYAFGKQFISAEAGLLMATIMYLLPMTMHQSFADMKTDMPLFFFIVVGFLVLFLVLRETKATRLFWQLLAIAGAILGTALAIKITTAIALFALVAVLAWRFSGPFSGVAAFAFLHSIYFYFFVRAIDISADFRLWTGRLSLLIAIIGLSFVFLRKEKIIFFIRAMVIFGISLGIILVPWLIKNIAESPTITVDTLLFGGPSPAPTLNWSKIGVNVAACSATGGQEELGRYIASAAGPTRYLGLPWDMTMNINQAGFYVDISFLFLAFIPLLLLLGHGWWRISIVVLLFVVPLLLYWLGIWPSKTYEFITYTPFFFLLALIPQAIGLTKQTEEKELVEFWQNSTALFLVSWYFWLFVASGVPWYGVAGFLFALLLVVRSWQLATQLHVIMRVGLTIIIIISVSSMLFLRESRFSNTNMLSFAFGLKTEEQVLATTNAQYPAILKKLNTDQGHYIYRVGTFINYFIDDNRERVFDDPQLDAFKCIDGAGLDNARTAQRLKDLGFRYLVYDTNTQTIEKDKNGTLHQKVNRFTNFASTHLKAIVPTDPAKFKEGIVLFEIP